MRALRPLRRLAEIEAVARALRIVEPLSCWSCHLVTRRRESWCARAWRRRKACWRARLHVTIFGPRHCCQAARWWAN